MYFEWCYCIQSSQPNHVNTQLNHARQARGCERSSKAELVDKGIISKVLEAAAPEDTVKQPAAPAKQAAAAGHTLLSQTELRG